MYDCVGVMQINGVDLVVQNRIRKMDGESSCYSCGVGCLHVASAGRRFPNAVVEIKLALTALDGLSSAVYGQRLVSLPRQDLAGQDQDW